MNRKAETKTFAKFEWKPLKSIYFKNPLQRNEEQHRKLESWKVLKKNLKQQGVSCWKIPVYTE